MPSPLFLAMTAAEFLAHGPGSTPMGWMACHFSPYGTGLSNCPDSLPEDSLLIVNDRTPVCGHDASLIAEELTEIVERCRCSRVLLDFQRPGDAQTAAIAAAAVQALPCPVGVSALYANGLSCPVCLPPVPLAVPFSDYILPWSGREIWLELGLDMQRIRVTPEGSRRQPLPFSDVPLPHADKQLHCRYGIAVSPDAVAFTLRRGPEELKALMADAEKAGIGCLIGLYQELGHSIAQ